MLTSGEIWGQVYRDILSYFFQLFCTPTIFFFPNNKKKVLHSCIQAPEVRRKWSCDLSPASEGIFCCSCNSMGLSVWPAQGPQTHKSILRIFDFHQIYGFDETQKNSGTRCAGRHAASLRAPPCCSAVGIVSFRCSYLVSQREFCVIEGGPHQSPPPSEPRKQTA